MIPCVILTGGMGTRISSNFPDIPKALIPVTGKPFIDWKLRQLEEQGVNEVYLLTGVGGDQIYSYVSRNVTSTMRICFIPDGLIPLGTAGAIKSALAFLPDYFLLTFGDTLLDERIPSFVTSETYYQKPNLLVVSKSLGPSDSFNVLVEDKFVVNYSKTIDQEKMNFVDYGYALLNSSAFGEIEQGVKADLSSVLLNLIANRDLVAHQTSESYYEIGTPEGLARTVDRLKQL
jgi:NDP-sugar pyrophosphorylase family protein